eukprot:g970.t1
MILLFETAAGYALFRADGTDLKSASGKDVYKHFSSQEKALASLSLHSFDRFDDTTAAVAASTALVESRMDKSLKAFLKKEFKKKTKEGGLKGLTLGVSDPKLGSLIKEKLGIDVVSNPATLEALRAVRTYKDELLQETLKAASSATMTLGLSHSLGRYKLKFSPDKVDTMIVQAIALLDELDKEVNTYAMRVREWYGWHFPEMGKIVEGNATYAKAVKLMGYRTKAKDCDFSTIGLDDETEENLKKAAEISMGTEISDIDRVNIEALCDQVIALTDYRTNLFNYLKNRMNAIAPNLTILVGELVGARLIAHSGSLMNLAKQPASTVQILGAEKALFRALKTKQSTPKYGLIYHSSLIGSASAKNKGKISRVLAAKCALGIRVDALGDNEDGPTIGIEGRAKVEERLRQLEGGQAYKSAGKGKVQTNLPKDNGNPAATLQPLFDYNASGDVQLKKEGDDSAKKSKKKRKLSEVEANGEASDDAAERKKKKKKKKEKKEKKEKKKKKKKKSE